MRLALECTRWRAEWVKWVVIAIGAAVSFWVIDFGKLKLDRLRLASAPAARCVPEGDRVDAARRVATQATGASDVS